MNKRIPAVIFIISNSFCDFTLDVAVNKYNMYFVLFGTALGSFIMQLVYGFINGISMTFSPFIFILINGFCMLLGYIYINYYSIGIKLNNLIYFYKIKTYEL